MSAFSYQALDTNGRVVKGVLDGDSERHVRHQLRGRSLKPIVVVGTDKGMEDGIAGLRFRRRGIRISVRERSLLTRQLASLVRSGLPLSEALQVAAEQSGRAAVKSLLLQVRSRVQEGRSLAQALAEHPAAFDDMFCAMVRAGESAGFLGEVLERLAEYAESGQQLQQRLQMAMIYPLALLGVAVLVVSLLMVFVVPSLTGIFVNSGQELPTLTVALIAVSEFFTSVWALVVLVVLAILLGGFQYWLQDVGHRTRWHALLLRTPVLGNILRQSDSARFASTLSILIGSGVPLLDALRIAGRVLRNRVLSDRSAEVAEEVKKGSTLNRAMRRAEVFPPLLVQMVASGEANGSLADQLAYASDNQNRELEMKLGTTMALLEPLTIIVMGGIVTVIMLAILLPIFAINTLV